MNKLVALSLLIFLGASIALEAWAAESARGILGVQLKMTGEQARTRLKEIGILEREERKQQEIWKVRDKSFSHLIIGVGKDDKLRFVTAVAREDKEAKRVGYGEIGKLEQARQAGDVAIKNFNYEWTLPQDRENPPTLVAARGRDPKFLTTYTLKRLGADKEGEDDEGKASVPAAPKGSKPAQGSAEASPSPVQGPTSPD
jgi:hypothetical protein